MTSSWQGLDKQVATVLAAHGGDQSVVVKPSAVRACNGDGNAAILLSQLLFWSKRTKDPDGWFYNTAIKLEEQTGLGKRAQATARKNLKALGVLEDRVKGSPPIVHFRLNLEVVARLLVEAQDSLQRSNQSDRMRENQDSLQRSDPYKEIKEETTEGIPPTPQREGNLVQFPSGSPSVQRRTANVEGGEREGTTPPPTPSPKIDPKVLEQAEVRMLDAGRSFDSKSNRRVTDDRNGWATQPPERLQALKDGIWKLWHGLNPGRVTRKDIDRLPFSVAPDEIERFKAQTRAYIDSVDDKSWLMSLKRWNEEWRDWAPPPQATASSFPGRQAGPSVYEEIAMKLRMDGRKTG